MNLEQAMKRISELEEELAQMRQAMAWLKRKTYAGGMGETADKAQMMLHLEILERSIERLEKQKISYERTPGNEKRQTLDERFDKLPLKETVVIEPEEVKAAPEKFEKIGEEVTTELDVTLAKFYRRVIIRPKYRLKEDKSAAPVVAAAPARPVTGYASAGLIAWVLINKYVLHLPLYRQEKDSARHGVRISRQSMAEWVEAGSGWLEIIYKRMLEKLKAGDYVQCDETPIKCQDPDVEGKTVQGWLWVISRPGGDVVFRWRMSREYRHAFELLQGFKGLLQSDGFAAYCAQVKAGEGIVHLGCWVHARRYFHKALEESPRRAGLMIRAIGHLYHWESLWDKRGVGPRMRSALRHAHFGLTLKWIKRLAIKLKELEVPKSALAKACGYLLGHWDVLVAHLEHGKSRLDNNLVENSIRPSAIGKKNWLFIGHPDAGDRSAIIYSIVVTCERYGIDPLAYVADMLRRLPALKNRDDIDALLPVNWKGSTSAA